MRLYKACLLDNSSRQIYVRQRYNSRSTYVATGAIYLRGSLEACDGHSKPWVTDMSLRSHQYHAVQLADTPLIHTIFRPTMRLLVVSRPAEGRRPSWLSRAHIALSTCL